MDLSLQKCRRHSFREAAALCPECKGFFCRECVTEHNDKVICSDCLAELTKASHRAPGVLQWFSLGSGAFLGLFVLWLMFYGFGKFLLALPSSFHEGSFWTETVLKDMDK